MGCLCCCLGDKPGMFVAKEMVRNDGVIQGLDRLLDAVFAAVVDIFAHLISSFTSLLYLVLCSCVHRPIYSLFLAQFVEAVGLKRFHQVGESLGACVSSSYGATYPHKLDSLTLLCPPSECTVEPTNNGHIGDERFVHCSEAVHSSKVEKYW